MVETELIQIGEFAKLAGTNLRTLRYYEELGLLVPASRSSGGFRYYRRDQTDRVAAIKRLQSLGLQLKDVAAVLSPPTNGTGPPAVDRLRNSLEQQVELTEQRIAALRGELQELSDAHDRLTELCKACDHVPSLDCDPCPRDGQRLPPALRGLL